MDDRFERFKKGELLPNELKAFIHDIENMSDEEINAGLDSVHSPIEFSQDDINQLHERLLTDIDEQDFPRSSHNLIIWIAASIIVILSITLGLFYAKISDYQKYQNTLFAEITVNTQNGETATAELPDGSRIKLGPSSGLTYTLASFNDNERRIKWEGEGHFEITKMTRNPFSISSGFLEITVLGTTFNLLRRENLDHAEINLQEGSVRITVPSSGETATMTPGETAFISKSTGDIKIYRNGTDHRYSVGETSIYFTSRTLSDIAQTLELYYGKTVEISPTLKSELFTGSIPTNDLDEALTIINKTFHANSESIGNRILIK